MRRITDIVVALIVLSLLTPLLLVVGLAIVISSPGNPFYRGWRVGKNGRRFRLWKFRTMVRNAVQIGPAITVRNDSRITPLGRLLRKTKLDELPQFLNVMAGEMTLVGPRPEAPEIVDLYDGQQRNVLLVKPGVTGLVQLKWADESEEIPQGDGDNRYYIENLLDKKLQVDLEYLRTRTSLTDAQIVWRTAALILRRLVSIPLKYRRSTSAA